ncbi:MAG: hypothetical protein HQ538_04080 [Parcubacteria group bacterium]|nr:hypothetical protein [Parcubacteria group bacterium]
MKKLTADRSPLESQRVDLKRIIETAPESRIVKPSRIGKGDVDNRRVSQYLDDLEFWHGRDKLTKEDPLTRGWANCEEAGYVGFDPEGKAYFFPVDPRIIADRGEAPSFLLHIGEFRGKGDNIANLQQHGVFGNPDQKQLTYLMLADSTTVTFPKDDELDGVDILVDIEKLMERRTIYLDPESMSLCGTAVPHFSKDKFGDSYIIPSGIPKESISQCVLPSTGEVLRFGS